MQSFDNVGTVISGSEDSGHIIDLLLKGEFVSVHFSFDDEHCAYNLMCCCDVQ